MLRTCTAPHLSDIRFDKWGVIHFQVFMVLFFRVYNRFEIVKIKIF